MLKWLKTKKLPGFTLLELVVVIVVIGILAAIAIPTFSGVITRANDAKAQTTLNAIARDALVIYKMDNGSTPLDWYNAFNEAVAETPVASEYILAAESNLTLALDLPHATEAELALAAQVAAGVTGPVAAVAGPSTSPSQLSIFADSNGNVGMALASSGNCVFGTLIGESITTWSAKKDLGADCAGAVAFIDPVTVANLEYRDVSKYSDLTVPVAGTLGTPVVTSTQITFAVNFTATPTAPINSFEVSRNGVVLEATILAPLSSYTDNTTINGVPYTYSVRAQNTIGYSTAVSTSPLTSYAVPNTPAFATQSAGISEVSLAWDEVTGTVGTPVDGYRIYKSVAGGAFVYLTQLSGTSYTDTTLTNGTDYAYQIETFGTGGTSARVTSSTLRPLALPIVTSAIAEAIDPNTGSITYETTNSVDKPTTGVRIYNHATNALLATGADNPMLVPGLIAGNSYTFDVEPYNSMGAGAKYESNIMSTISTVTSTSTITPSAANTTVTLNWSAVTSTSAQPVDTYLLQASPNGSTGWTTIYSGALLTYADTSLTNGTEYFYKVAAVNAAGTGTYSDVVSATPVTGPAIPTAPAVSLAPTSIELTITAVTATAAAPVSGYRIYRSVAGGAFIYLTQQVSTSYTDTGLTQGVTYAYQVSAYGSGGESARSADSITLTPIGTPALITGLTATNAAPTVTISWAAATSTTSNPVTSLEVLKNGVVVSTLAANATTYSYTLLTSGAYPGTAYTFAVRAKNALTTAASTTATSTLYTAAAAANYTCSSGGTYQGTGTAAGSCGTYPSWVQTGAAYYDCNGFASSPWITYGVGGAGTCRLGNYPAAQQPGNGDPNSNCTGNPYPGYYYNNGWSSAWGSNVCLLNNGAVDVAATYHAATGYWTYPNYPAATISSYTYSCPSGGTRYATECRI